MRTVRDDRGITWMCLELPEIPVAPEPIDDAAVAAAGDGTGPGRGRRANPRRRG